VQQEPSICSFLSSIPSNWIARVARQTAFESEAALRTGSPLMPGYEFTGCNEMKRQNPASSNPRTNNQCHLFTILSS
jgi:hypothetical protein